MLSLQTTGETTLGPTSIEMEQREQYLHEGEESNFSRSLFDLGDSAFFCR